MNIGIIVQARMGSSRLPGKILTKFYGEETLIETILKNLHNVKDAKIIVATSINSNNDHLSNFLKSKDEIVYRGSENDVLERFIRAAEDNKVDGIVRICSDNPFIDWHSITKLIDKAKSSGADYVGFRINNLPSIKTHFGFWGEFVKLEALKIVASTTDRLSLAHEHVTIHIYTNSDKFKCEWIECPAYLQGRNDIRLTIDTQEDMDNAKKVYSDLKSLDDNFDLKQVVDYLDNHPKIKQSMLRIINNNLK